MPAKITILPVAALDGSHTIRAYDLLRQTIAVDSVVYPGQTIAASPVVRARHFWDNESWWHFENLVIEKGTVVPALTTDELRARYDAVAEHEGQEAADKWRDSFLHHNIDENNLAKELALIRRTFEAIIALDIIDLPITL